MGKVYAFILYMTLYSHAYSGGVTFYNLINVNYGI